MNFRILFFIISGVIGSGIFFTPYDLQFFGLNSFLTFILVSTLFGTIGYLFANSNSNSLFELIDKRLGSCVGFFISWLYWIVSWSTTIIVIGEIFRYFTQIFPCMESYESIVKCSFVIIFILLNCFKNSFSKFIEVFINIVKFIPLIIFPFICFFSPKFSFNNLSSIIDIFAIVKGFPQVMWCFVGVECGAIVNKKLNISKITILGIFIVAIVYIINLIGIFGIMGYKLPSYTPYSDTMQYLFGNIGKIIFSSIVFFVTMGALNVWISSSTEVCVDNSKLGYFPKILQKQNKYGANYLSVLVSSLGLIPLCLFESTSILRTGVSMASNGFLMFYSVFCLAYFLEKKSTVALLCFLICSTFFIYSSSVSHLLVILGILILGIPLYILFLKRRNFKNFKI